MSELRANVVRNAAGDGPVELFKQAAAKSWANLNGTGTVALRDSLNISSVIDNGLGDYTNNFASAMASAEFRSTCEAVGGVSGAPAGNEYRRSIPHKSPTVSSVRMGFADATGSAFSDPAYVGSAVFGSLA